MTERRGRLLGQLLDDLKIKESIVEIERRSTRSLCVENSFGRDYGHVVRQTAV
jgi:hypothetical protein